MNRWLRYVLWFFGILTLILGIALLSTQTRQFKDWLRDMVVSQARSSLNGELVIGQIEGNFFTHLQVRDLAILSESDTILTLANLRADFSPRRILSRVVMIDHLLIEGLSLNLRQLPDSSWNLEHLVIPDSTPPDTTASGLAGWMIDLPDVAASRMKIGISVLDPAPGIPRAVDNFEFTLSARLSDEQQSIHLTSFRLNTHQPDLQLRELAFQLVHDRQTLSLSDFVLRTSGNGLDASANAKLADDSLSFFLDLAEQEQRLELSGGIGALSRFLDSSSVKKPRFTLAGTFTHIDPGHWLADPALTADVNGSIKLSGKDIDPKKMRLDVDLTLLPSRISDYTLNGLKLGAVLANDNFKSTGTLNAPAGRIQVSSQVNGVSQQQDFTLKASLRNIDLAQIMHDDSLHSDLNLNLQASGRGFDPQTMSVSAGTYMLRSRLFDLPLDTLFAQVVYQNQLLQIDTMEFTSAFARLTGGGQVSIDSESQLRLQIHTDDFSALSPLTGMKPLRARGLTDLQLSGPATALKITANGHFGKIIVDTLAAIDSVDVQADLLYTAAGISGGVRADLQHADVATFPLNTLGFKGQLEPGQIDIALTADRKDLAEATLDARYFPLEPLPRVVIPSLNIQFGTLRWQGGSDSTEVIVGESAYAVHNFELTAHKDGVADPAGKLSADGTIGLEGEADFQLLLQGFDLEVLAQAIEPSLSLGGTFGAELGLTGTAAAPLLQGNLEISDGKLNDFNYKSLRSDLDYRNRQFDWNLNFQIDDTSRISGKGFVPMNLALNNTGGIVDLDAPFHAELRSERLPLSVINAAGERISNIKGKILLDIQVDGSANAPVLDARLGVKDGALNYETYGMEYQDIQLDIQMDRKRVNIERFSAKRDKGFLSLSGYVEFDSSLVTGIIHASELQITADDFWLARNRDFEINIGSDISLSGDAGAPVFGGTLSVLRSRFYLPAFIEGMVATTIDPGTPLLIAAMREQQVAADSTPPVPAEADTAGGEAAADPIDYYTNLTGTMKVSIPRNTWLRSEEMNMEISGDLDVVKNGLDFELFGPLNIIRGQYDLLGRRFTIKEGALTFSGGTDYDPEIVLTAEYVFRAADRSKRYLVLNITGQSLTPEISFTLDDAAIDEGDAVSYLMFGRSMDELTQGQKATAATEESAGSGELARGMAANLIAGQLASTLGNRFNLDMIEIKGEDNWAAASFVVGKYITTDLFMSYERGFGDATAADIPPETITLEYELTRQLFLQLIQGDVTDSGFDLIWKYQWP